MMNDGYMVILTVGKNLAVVCIETQPTRVEEA